MWDIRPLSGMGPLSLDMTEKDVSNILDLSYPVSARHTAYDGSLDEYRGLNCPSLNYNKDRVRSIQASSNCKNVSFDGVDVFNENPRSVMVLFYEKNGGAKYAFGGLLFEALGISAGGFYIKGRGFYKEGYDDGQDERTVCVNKKDAFAALIDDFKDVKLKGKR